MINAYQKEQFAQECIRVQEAGNEIGKFVKVKHKTWKSQMLIVFDSLKFRF